MVDISNRISGTLDEHELRAVAPLRMVHALATRLHALADVAAIGDAITTELKTLIDYHNCRIYLLLEDGLTLWPVTFLGELTEYESETPEELVTQVGEGITGYAAISGQTYYAPDALHDERGIQIEGTDEIEESLLAVPLKAGDKVTGVIVLSKLGTDQFEDDDQRVLEVLASHASVAYENARLLQKEREAAKTSSALLGLSQELSGAGDVSSVLARVVAAVPASRFLASFDEPFVIDRDMAEQVPTEFWLVDEPSAALIAPMSWEPDEFGALVVLAPNVETTFSEHDRDLA